MVQIITHGGLNFYQILAEIFFLQFVLFQVLRISKFFLLRGEVTCLDSRKVAV